jgi:hypothetical protein
LPLVAQAQGNGSLAPSSAGRILLQETIVDLRIDPVQPLLGALGFLTVRFGFGLKPRDTVLGSAKLLRQPFRRFYCLPTVLVHDISSFIEKLQDGLSCFVELSLLGSSALRRPPER